MESSAKYNFFFKIPLAAILFRNLIMTMFPFGILQSLLINLYQSLLRNLFLRAKNQDSSKM